MERIKLYKEVVLIIIKNKDKYLFQLRDDNINIPYPNTWSLFGGGIEENETPKEALLRELKEETNIIVKNIKYLSEFLKKETKQKLYFFYGETDMKEEKIKVYEGQKAEYFNLSEIKKIKIEPSVKEFFQKWKE